MKTLRKIEVTVEEVSEIPNVDILTENTLYKSKHYLSHNCLCGCGDFINLPISNGGWSFSNNEGKATLTPSVLNGNCKAHYIITNGVANMV
jgi:hypothetical protein